jgi:prepilin-type N-terminal cleavage/methylation domain-containing protein
VTDFSAAESRAALWHRSCFCSGAAAADIRKALTRGNIVQLKRQQSGFTLVEIAIVLVIIGLLLGGILKGQEMIVQARIKNIINDLNGITAAYASYQDRYRAIPGDDQGALARWSLPAASATPSSPGDGTVDGAYNAATAAAEPESRLFWWHLRQAGFIPGATTPSSQASQQPTNAVSGMIGVQTGTGVATMGMAGLIVCSANIPDKIAIAVDTQTDDQNALTGSLRGQLQAGSNPAIAAGGPGPAYAETGANQYLLCKGV